MSIVDDQIRQLDALLDKYQLATAASTRTSLIEADSESATHDPDDSPRGHELKSVVRALSTSSNSRPVLARQRLRHLIRHIAKSKHGHVSTQSVADEELAWLATGKATIQIYGVVLNSLLEQTLPLSESIWYWDEVLGSYTSTGLYTIQTGPRRFWKQATEVYHDAKEKFQARQGLKDSAHEASQSLADGWREFYALVQKSVKERSLVHARSKVLSPFALCRVEARKNQTKVRKLRETSATAIGLLVDEGLSFQPLDDEYKTSSSPATPDKLQWQGTIAKSVSLIENVLNNAGSIENSLSEFEETVFSAVDRDPEFVSVNDETETTTDPSKLATRLIQILDTNLPDQETGSRNMSVQFGIPSRWIRYWMPGLVLLLSGSTLLRVVANRRAEIVQWVQDFGATTRDFWLNWVVEPTRRLIGTIRHDEQSEIAIMSKDSLRADRESLERMVVDFAVQHPENGVNYTEPQIVEIRSKVKEGDLTPVLRAYEREMQSPIKNAVMGDLIRTLLIQVQKTKVDVEVALGGIDSLLKSQELLFGFVGIAPGVLISYFVFQWLRGTLSGKRGIAQGKQRGESVRLLRNIDRTLSNAHPTQNGILTYKDHGLLLCEVHLLRQRAMKVLPGNVQREFLEDVNDLMDIRIGIERQMQVVERLQWAYAKWWQ